MKLARSKISGCTPGNAQPKTGPNCRMSKSSATNSKPTHSAGLFEGRPHQRTRSARAMAPIARPSASATGRRSVRRAPSSPSASRARRPRRSARLRRSRPARIRSADLAHRQQLEPDPLRRRRTREQNRSAGCSTMSSGVPSCASWPLLEDRDVVARRSASSMSWVTNTIVLPVARWMRAISPCSASRVIGSTAANGSSISKHVGVGGERAGDADALLLAARQLVRIFAAIGRRGRGAAASTARPPAPRTRSRGQPQQPRHGGDVVRDPPMRKQPDRLDRHSRCAGAAPRAGPARTSSPPTRIAPRSKSTSRLIIRKVVDLPQPEGPSRTQNAPCGHGQRQFVDDARPS